MLMQSCYDLIMERNKMNIGRWFYASAHYKLSREMPTSFDCFNYFQWIYYPKCRRGLEYDFEMQTEISLLEKENRRRLKHNSYLHSKVPL